MKNIKILVIINTTVLCGELAVPYSCNPLQQGRMSFSESIVKAERLCVVLKKRSCAKVNCESCQVRKEAALSKSNFVPQGGFFGARQTAITLAILYNKECTVFFLKQKSANRLILFLYKILFKSHSYYFCFLSCASETGSSAS